MAQTRNNTANSSSRPTWQLVRWQARTNTELDRGGHTATVVGNCVYLSGGRRGCVACCLLLDCSDRTDSSKAPQPMPNQCVRAVHACLPSYTICTTHTGLCSSMTCWCLTPPAAACRKCAASRLAVGRVPTTLPRWWTTRYGLWAGEMMRTCFRTCLCWTCAQRRGATWQ